LNQTFEGLKYTLIHETFCDECAEKKRRLEEEFGGR